MDLAIIISATVFSILIVIILIISAFWIFKSKQRKEERFERRNSLRSSIRSRSQLTMLSSHPSRLNYLDSRSNISDNYIIGHHSVDRASMVSVEKSKNNSFITDATEITPESTLQRNHNKINNNIHMVDYDEFEPSFTEDEESIASDIQTEPNTRIHSNIDIINALKAEKSKSADVIYSNVPCPNQKMSKTSLNSEVPSELFSNDQHPILSSEKKNAATSDEPPSPPPPLEDYKPSKRLLNLKKNINKYPITSKSSSLEGITGQGLGKEIHQNPQLKDPYHERLAENREPSPVMSVKSQGSQGNISDIFAVADSCIPPSSKICTFPRQEKPFDQQYHDYTDSHSDDLDPGIGYMQRNTFDRSSQDHIDVDYLNFNSRSPHSANFRSNRKNLDSPTPRPRPMPRQVTSSHSSQENLDHDRSYQPSPQGNHDDLQDTGTIYMSKPPVPQKFPKAPRATPSRRPHQRTQYLETEIL